MYYTSELYIDKFGPSKIIEKLKNEYTISEIAEHHKKICSLPWKRIYTTNYDNIIEQSCVANGVVIDSASISSL